MITIMIMIIMTIERTAAPRPPSFSERGPSDASSAGIWE